MKKVLLKILVLCTAVCAMLCAFTACEDNNAADAPIHKHSFVDFTVNPTCTAAGYTLHKCACGEEYKDNFTDALSHNYINGKCSLCGATDPNYTEPVEECTHDYAWTTVKEPTETQEGVKSGVCKKCGDTITQAIPTLSHEHNYIITVKAPTCTSGGFTLFTCSCGKEYKDNFANAKGHDYEWTTVKEPTCTEKGKKTATGIRCLETKAEEIEELGHVPGILVIENEIAAACEEKGSYDAVVYCEECGEELSRDHCEIDELGHQYNDGICLICGDELYVFTLLSNDTYEIYLKDKSVLFSELTIPSTYNDKVITRIGEEAFSEQKSLQSIIIPDTISSIGKYAFYNCEMLNETNIPESVVDIGDYAFYNCKCIKKLIIPNSVERIGKYAFYGCLMITDLTIGSAVNKIGSYAFYNTHIIRAYFLDAYGWTRYNGAGQVGLSLENKTAEGIARILIGTYSGYYWYKNITVISVSPYRP